MEKTNGQLVDKSLIQLAHCNAGIVTSGNKRTEWVIRENITEVELGRLPSRLNEKEVFSILAFARKYELKAFNTGIDFGKKKIRETLNPRIVQLEENIRLARNENERLADALDEATRKK